MSIESGGSATSAFGVPLRNRDSRQDVSTPRGRLTIACLRHVTCLSSSPRRQPRPHNLAVAVAGARQVAPGGPTPDHRGLLVGGSTAASTQQNEWAYRSSGGLITLLALVAAVMLAFSGSYPRGLFDLLMGLNRWVCRVWAYVMLMTDEYPPFRLDSGGDDPMTAPDSPVAPGDRR